MIAFEPWATARAQSERNRDLNTMTNVEILDYALAGENGRRLFYAPTGSNTGTGSLLPDYFPGNNTESTSILACRGDDAHRELGVARPAILKIDVEGAEREVLTGLGAFIHNHYPNVIMGFSDAT